MTTVENSARVSDRSAPSSSTLLIDTDVHELYRSIDDLRPYLNPHWERYTHQLWAGLPASPYSWPLTNKAGSRLEWELEDGTAGTDIDAMRHHLFDEEGVSIAILNGFFHVSSMPVLFEFAEALAAAYNDWQIEHWLEKDPRIRGSVHVVAHNPTNAASEIDRVAAHPQIVQVFLPLVTDRQYGDPFYRPIYEAALRNDLVVTLHHGGGHTQTALGWPRYWIEWHTVAAPQIAQNQLLSLIVNGTFEKYPELKVVVLETGVAWLPWFMWRLDQQYRESRHEVPWVKRLPSEHMRDSVRIATQPMADITPQQFFQLVEMTDSDRMYVFATDYPHYDADSAEKVLPRTLPEDLRRRIRYENALDTFPRLRIGAP